MQIWQNCDLLEVKLLPPVGPKVSLVDVLRDLARDMRVLTTFSGQSDIYPEASAMWSIGQNEFPSYAAFLESRCLPLPFPS